MPDLRFRPPLPPRPARSPQGLGLLRALRTNVLDLWPDAAYESEVLEQSFFGRKLILLNSPEAIRHVLIENDINYGRSPIRMRILRPIAGGGLLLSEGETWRRQRQHCGAGFRAARRSRPDAPFCRGRTRRRRRTHRKIRCAGRSF